MSGRRPDLTLPHAADVFQRLRNHHASQPEDLRVPGSTATAAGKTAEPEAVTRALA
jgi:hypothetical protein